MEICSLCGKKITNENAPVLTMGGYGIPRYLCDECAEEIDTATESRELESIAEAIESLGKKLNGSDHDEATSQTMTDILNASAERYKAIREGNYDFEADEDNNEQELEEIPEEMLESEEDKLLDEQEEKKFKKYEKILNWVSAIVLGGLGAFLIYRILDIYLF